MIGRNLQKPLLELLQNNAAVVLTGPRQMGKTTLALAVSASLDAVYRDLENPRELRQVRDIELFMEQFPEELVVLDEVQRIPELFAPLRGIIDKRRREGQPTMQFLLLGSASLKLLSQTSESLAGRVAYAELYGINILELRNSERKDIDANSLWLRGGYPESLLARADSVSLQWRYDLIRSYLERDVPQFGFRIPAETLHRFWTMLAHHQGGVLNAASLAKGLGISGQSVARYLDILVDLLLVRRLPPWHGTTGKRLVKSPRVYVRDTGLLHALLDISTIHDLLGHPVVGHSWESFVVENLINISTRHHYRACFYRTQSGAEVDLVLAKGGKPEIAIEIKRSSAPKAGKGFQLACDDLGLAHRYVVYPGEESYRLSGNIWVTSIIDLMVALEEQEGMSFR